MTDDPLKLAADAGLEVSAAEEALGEGAAQAAEDALDRAAEALEELRRRWPAMPAGERTVVGKVAREVRDRLDGTRARLPARRALSTGEPEIDPEQEDERALEAGLEPPIDGSPASETT